VTARFVVLVRHGSSRQRGALYTHSSRQPKPDLRTKAAPTCFGRGFDGGKKIKGIKIHLAVDKYGFPLAINVSPANKHDSKGIVPVLHQLAGGGFKGTALGDLSYRGQRLSKRRLASPSNPAPAATAEPSFRRVFGSSAPWHGLVATVG
jgi:hypothetical protein